MISGETMVASLERLGVTDVVWLPDSAMGPWEASLCGSRQIRLRRVCREGETWALAAGLYLGGRRPLVMIQSTGLFESGDALRNVMFDLKLPLFALVGYRSYLVANSADSARAYLEPILRAWQINYVILDEYAPIPGFEAHYQSCRAQGIPGAALLPEGRM